MGICLKIEKGLLGLKEGYNNFMWSDSEERNASLVSKRENILKAKLEMLEGMAENAPLVINNDNDMLHNWYLENKGTRKIITFGIENESDVMAKNIDLGEDGSKFEVKIYDEIYNAKINVRRKSFCDKCIMCDSCGNSK